MLTVEGTEVVDITLTNTATADPSDSADPNDSGDPATTASFSIEKRLEGAAADLLEPATFEVCYTVNHGTPACLAVPRDGTPVAGPDGLSPGDVVAFSETLPTGQPVAWAPPSFTVDGAELAGAELTLPAGPVTVTLTNSLLHDLRLLKVGPTPDGGPQPLSGASFALHPDDDGAPGRDSIPVRTEDGSLFHAEGLSPGRYWLTETRAPDGYQALVGAVPLVVHDSGRIELVEPHPQVSLADPQTVASGEGPHLTVMNLPGLRLPEAGGDRLLEHAILAAGLLSCLATIPLLASDRLRDRRPRHAEPSR
ncbi:prealbumin-like fold domain-containing protein [Xylanimonas allomyrinae]|uniref:prealbumin-like fold domain-containing protein n=1 Tax=Xylanimonas allomyrinae TaxID=2509459 RepID=UPI0013A65EC1|nr:prealbumin-like fold domain-containing protein [Xylanimonas allomyrinae]